MTTSALLSTEQQRDIVMVEQTCIERGTFAILSIVRPGRLRWAGPWLLWLPLRWQDLWRGMRPRKFRWGLVLLLAIGLCLLMGEVGPTASLIVAWP